MGCDIHFVVERKQAGDLGWLGVYSTDACFGECHKFRQRDYGFFARVAGVRGRCTEGVCHYQKGLPRDISALAWHEFSAHPSDHHSPSVLPLRDFCNAWLAENPRAEVREGHIVYDLTGIYQEEGEEHRVVFWFDN
jgi:hypothetical protein